MAKEIFLSNKQDARLDIENPDFYEHLKKLFQSGYINFLIGSGASVPAIELVGDLEEKLTQLYKQDTDQTKIEAATKEAEFKEKLKQSKDALLADSITDDKLQSVLYSYTEFLKHMEAILADRKNPLLPKQVNVFTTNYDLFVEKASESVASLVLNDGFDRSPKLNQKFEFSSKNFFKTVYYNGTVYAYEVELPSVNLVKLHGSCSWKVENDKIFFDVSHEESTIILPRKQKFAETVINQTYYDLLRLYANELDKENALLLVFGFSFADEHILDITRRALKNPTLQIIIFCFEENQKESYQEKFKAYSNVEIVFFETEKIDFPKLNELLAYIPPVKPEPKVKVVFER